MAESSTSKAETPVKWLRTADEELGIRTPSGGVIFNPFHKDLLNRVGQITFSPGIFAPDPSPTGTNDSSGNTPNRPSIPFVFSPDTQSDLFPADIDENPVLQLKLQECLDLQVCVRTIRQGFTVCRCKIHFCWIGSIVSCS